MPWGTPDTTGSPEVALPVWERIPSTTLWVRLWGKQDIQARFLPPRPYKRNLRRSLLGGTESKALEKSKTAMSTVCFLSKRFRKSHTENSPVTQTTPKPTLLSWGGWPHENFLPHPWPNGKPGLIALIGKLRPYCSQKPFDLAQVCHGNKICSKRMLTWKLTLELAFPVYRIKSWMEFVGPILAKLH